MKMEKLDYKDQMRYKEFTCAYNTMLEDYLQVDLEERPALMEHLQTTL